MISSIWWKIERRRIFCCSTCGPTRSSPIFSLFAAATTSGICGALTETVRFELKEKYQKLPFTNEGSANSGWVVMDYGDVVVHFFAPEKRAFYGLEDLWDAASKVMLRIQ